MSNLYKEYSDSTSKVKVFLPAERIKQCKELGIPVAEIVKHRERYNAINIANNWEHCAVRALEERKMKMRNSQGKFSWL